MDLNGVYNGADRESGIGKMDSVKRLHRYLVDQAFYTIVLSSLFSVCLFVGRVIYSGSLGTYSNLVWNLFLAWVPYLFSMLADGLNRLFPRRWGLQIIPGIIWLLFFPNAPYILTDFFHLSARPSMPLWYDILMLISFSWTGLFLAMASLRTMQRVVRFYFGNLLSWIFVLFSLMLCGIGIYLGRFERWNSWDMLTHPSRILLDVVRPMLNPLESLRFFGVSILFSIFLLICYLMIKEMGRPRSDRFQ
jgi:uncharacterized membrane protein